jgi:hypothetical protein
MAGEIDATSELSTVAYGNGLFIAYLPPYFLATYAPGQQWTSQRGRLDGALNSFAYGRGTFVGVGTSGLIVQSDSLIRGLLTGRFRSQGGFELGIAAEIGRPYRLQTSSDFLPNQWTDLLGFIPSHPITNIIDTAPAASHRFYRLVSP